MRSHAVGVVEAQPIVDVRVDLGRVHRPLAETEGVRAGELKFLLGHPAPVFPDGYGSA